MAEKDCPECSLKRPVISLVNRIASNLSFAQKVKPKVDSNTDTFLHPTVQVAEISLL
jgi:hypothetical protein